MEIKKVIIKLCNRKMHSLGLSYAKRFSKVLLPSNLFNFKLDEIPKVKIRWGLTWVKMNKIRQSVLLRFKILQDKKFAEVSIKPRFSNAIANKCVCMLLSRFFFLSTSDVFDDDDDETPYVEKVLSKICQVYNFNNRLSILKWRLGVMRPPNLT
jgi:hypothetical protein